jgi:hypothetical protein
MTPLHSTLKRALTIDGRDYVLTLTPTALKLALKGKRNGVDLSWAQLVNGEAALAVALHASLGAFAPQGKRKGKDPAAGPTAAAEPPGVAEPPAATKPSAGAKPAANGKRKRSARAARKK